MAKNAAYFRFKYIYKGDNGYIRYSFYSADGYEFYAAKKGLENWCKSKNHYPYKIVSYKFEVED